MCQNMTVLVVNIDTCGRKERICNLAKTNRPLYAKKINSSRLKEFGYNISNTFDEFMDFKEIIALSDSQMLRTIRDVNKRIISEDRIEYLINLKLFYGKMAKRESKKTKK